MKTTWEKLIRLGIIVINSSMKRVQVYAVIMLSVLGKIFLLFSYCFRTKNSYGLILGKRRTFIPTDYIESYHNQLNLY